MSKLFKTMGSFSKRSKSKADKPKSSNNSAKSRIYNRIGHWNFKKITRYALVLGSLLLIATSYLWYTRLYLTPERRFWSALNNSMATPSVVRTLTQGGSGNQVVQDYRFNFAPQRNVENKVVYTEKSASTNTSVSTEGVIFPTEQFLRYTAFSDTRADATKNQNIDGVLGKWASQTSPNAEEAKLNYLSEQVSLVIFGNYNSNFRHQMMSELKQRQVYGADLNTPLEDKVNDKPVYVYTISVKLRDYAELLNKAFVAAGYGEFSPLSPENYREDSIINGTILVSKKDNTVAGVSFGGRDEMYGNYGVVKQVVKPEASTTVEELQAQVQQLLQ